MSIPQPVLKDTVHPTKPDDLRFILEKLGRQKVIRLLASMGILAQGPIEEIIDRAVYSAHWDYPTTKLLRDMYAISNDKYLLTGFLIEDQGNQGISAIGRILRDIERNSRTKTQSEDDIFGIFNVKLNKEIIDCSFRYKHNRIKSDLQLFRDIPIDSDFSIYDTTLLSENGFPLLCVAIQPASSSDYKYILEEFINLLDRTRFIIRVFSLRSNETIPLECKVLSFKSCEQSNQFMNDLLESPAIDNTQIRDIPSIKMFKWDRSLISPEDANQNESVNIEADLDFHLKDLTASGVSLHRAKTTISALSSDKHAVSSLGVVCQNTEDYFYTSIDFKLQSARLDIALRKIS